MLARAELLYPDQMRADFQQFYGLNVDDMGLAFSHAHAAILLQQLPSDSRTAKAEHPELEWDVQTYLLNSMEYSLRWLVWAKTKNAQKGTNKQRPNETPAERAEQKRRLEGANKSFVDKVLGM